MVDAVCLENSARSVIRISAYYDKSWMLREVAILAAGTHINTFSRLCAGRLPGPTAGATTPSISMPSFPLLPFHRRRASKKFS